MATLSASPGADLRATTVITPDRGWFDWRLGQLWRYRDLITLFVWRDFVSIYKQTILGPLWHVIRPLINTLIFTIVFSRVVGISTDGAPPFLFYMTGTVLWSYFSNCLDNTSKTFLANSALLGKVYFHRLVIPVSLVFSNLVAFGIQFGILLVVMLIYAISGTALHVNAGILLIPLLLFILAGYALGAGLVVCALTARYRDLNYLISFSIQLLMYLTPVIYPISAVPAGYRWVFYLNPLSPIFEGFRSSLLGVGTVTMSALSATTLGMGVFLAAGLMIFTRAERTFTDTV